VDDENWVFEGFGGIKEKISPNAYGYTVPIPAAAWLFGTGLLGLVGIGRRKDLSRSGSYREFSAVGVSYQ
jgi:hypothetical protein